MFHMKNLACKGLKVILKNIGRGMLAMNMNHIKYNVQMVWISTCTSVINITQIFVTQGWGLLSQFPPFPYFFNFLSLSKHTLTVKYHVYIWQVLPQLTCGDTCQIWMWFKESKMYFCKIENFAYREIIERSFSNPHPWSFGPIGLSIHCPLLYT